MPLEDEGDDDTVEVLIECHVTYRYVTPCCHLPLLLSLAAWRDEDGDLCVDRSDAVAAMSLHVRRCRR